MEPASGPPAAPIGASAPRPDPNGFALVVALMALVGLTALATAGFLVTDSDYKVTQNHRSSVEAFYAADGAQKEYLARNGVPVAYAEYQYGQAEARVQTEQLLDMPGGLRLYTLSADANLDDPRGGGSNRAVGTVAIFTPFPLSAPGAFTATNGLVKHGVAGTISGYDAAPDAPCPAGVENGGQPAVAGVAVPTGGYEQKGTPGGQLVPDGDPPVADSLSAHELLLSTGIDWEGLVTGDKVAPDYTVPPDDWPDYSTLSKDEWPVIHITESYFELEPDHSGWGTLILDGDVAMKGDFSWDGLILGGGRLVSDGVQSIHGAIFTGLNQLLGETVEASEIGNGNKIFHFHSCNVEAAARSMGWLAEAPGSWYEVI